MESGVSPGRASNPMPVADSQRTPLGVRQMVQRPMPLRSAIAVTRAVFGELVADGATTVDRCLQFGARTADVSGPDPEVEVGLVREPRDHRSDDAADHGVP